jgi:hypothetical protein
MKWLLRLYPGDWRERYGEELEGLLAEVQLSPLGLLDLLRGTLDAWCYPIGSERAAGGPRRWSMKPTMQRLVGGLFILGAAAAILYLYDPGGWISHGTPCPDSVGASTSCVSTVISTSGFLALLWGIVLLGFTGLWLHARRTGRPSLLGETNLVVGVAGYLTLLRDSGILPNLGPWPSGYDLGLLGLAVMLLTVVLQGVALIKAHLLPLWSSAPLIVAPFLAYPVLALGSRLVAAGPARGPGVAVYFAVSWLLLGCGLLLTHPDTTEGPPSAPAQEPSAPA